ncbi:MAG: threonine/serine exporter family protein [Wenzhouxiangellaceae bacterium]|nr:threonine/serine exporter family protein [Wenzhouxiangellaceae bacterium]
MGNEPNTAPQPWETSRYPRLVLNLGRALLQVGSPAHRMETAMQIMADRLHLQAEFFCTPTALFVTLSDGDRQQTYLARVEPGATDLCRLSDLSDVMENLASGALDPNEADRQVRAIMARPPAYGKLVTVLAYVMISAGACGLIGGGLRESALAAVLGGITGLSVTLLWQASEFSRLLNPLSATLVTFFGTLWCGFDAHTALTPAVIAGMIALIPGMNLTASARELATGHQVSGAARLATTLIVFALLTVGLALGGWLAQMITGPLDARAVSELPLWAIPAGLVASTFGFVILFQARWRDWGWIGLACILAWSCSRLAGATGSPLLGAFAGALIVGLSGNLFARWTGRPGSILHLPALILLVPGSIGMKSLSALLGQDVVAGVEGAFLAGTVAVALATGLILASALVPPRTSL